MRTRTETVPGPRAAANGGGGGVGNKKTAERKKEERIIIKLMTCQNDGRFMRDERSVAFVS